MIFVALTFRFCVCVRDKWMNDSQRNQEITKSLNNPNSNSKGMTIVTWSKTMAKNSLCWTSPTPLLNPHKNTFFSLNKKWWCWRWWWWFSYLFMPSFHLCLCLCIIFHFTCIDQMCFCCCCLVYGVMMMDRKVGEKNYIHQIRALQSFREIVWVNSNIAHPFDTVIIILYPWHLHCFDMLRIQSTTEANKENT